MLRFRQSGLFNLTTLILLAIVILGMGFMYYKGYRLDIKTTSGAGQAGSSGQPGGFYYTVQVSVTPNEARAIDLTNALKQDGYDAYYDTYDGGRGRQYKIRVGQYGDKLSADAVKAQVRNRYNQFRDSFVRREDSL